MTITERMEFGEYRSTCSCATCQRNCQFMPGFLIPNDLERMIPEGTRDPFEWAEENLLASPGALAMKDGELFRIGTLVPAVKPDGSCIHLDEQKRCGIHAIAPFGCAFFDCKHSGERMSHDGLVAVMEAAPASLYRLIWWHLMSLGKVQKEPEVLRQKIREATRGEELKNDDVGR